MYAVSEISLYPGILEKVYNFFETFFRGNRSTDLEQIFRLKPFEGKAMKINLLKNATVDVTVEIETVKDSIAHAMCMPVQTPRNIAHVRRLQNQLRAYRSLQLASMPRQASFFAKLAAWVRKDLCF